jgi:hypothetical protein
VCENPEAWVPRLWRSDHDGGFNPALPGWADV